MAWTLLSAAEDSAPPPSARYGHGLTSVGGKLYVHGGISKALMSSIDTNFGFRSLSHGECTAVWVWGRYWAALRTACPAASGISAMGSEERKQGMRARERERGAGGVIER